MDTYPEGPYSYILGGKKLLESCILVNKFDYSFPSRQIFWPEVRLVMVFSINDN